MTYYQEELLTLCLNHLYLPLCSSSLFLWEFCPKYWVSTSFLLIQFWLSKRVLSDYWNTGKYWDYSFSLEILRVVTFPWFTESSRYPWKTESFWESTEIQENYWVLILLLKIVPGHLSDPLAVLRPRGPVKLPASIPGRSDRQPLYSSQSDRHRGRSDYQHLQRSDFKFESSRYNYDGLTMSWTTV
jgi:hypothetical protein